MSDRLKKYFRVDYDARLVDGTPFRPNTWTVLNDVKSIEGAAMRVRALCRREAKLRLGQDCVVSIRRVEEVTEKEFYDDIHDSSSHVNILNPNKQVETEAAVRGLLPTVIAEERKKAAALTRKLRRFSRKK
jgi:hypothetical protein